MKLSVISIAFQICFGCLVERWNYGRALTPDCATKGAGAIHFRGHGDAAQIRSEEFFFRAWRFLKAIYALANKGGMTAAALLRSVGTVDFKRVIYGLRCGECCLTSRSDD
jgi:hypothetical protein